MRTYSAELPWRRRTPLCQPLLRDYHNEGSIVHILTRSLRERENQRTLLATSKWTYQELVPIYRSASDKNNRPLAARSHMRQQRVRDIDSAGVVDLHDMHHPIDAVSRSETDWALRISAGAYPSSSLAPTSPPMPALFTRMSTRPHFSTAAFAMVSSSLKSSATSSSRTCIRVVSMLGSESNGSKELALRAVAITRSPRATIRWTSASPRPDEAPAVRGQQTEAW